MSTGLITGANSGRAIDAHEFEFRQDKLLARLGVPIGRSALSDIEGGRRAAMRGLILVAASPLAQSLFGPAPAAAALSDPNPNTPARTGTRMLVISGTMKIREDRLDEARHQAMLVMTNSAAEPGCRTYELSAQLADPLTLRLFEEWENAGALSAHFQTPHFQAFAAALPDILAGPAAFLRYEVAKVSSLQ